MKYLLTYEMFEKQLSLFPELGDHPKDVAKKFVQKFKVKPAQQIKPVKSKFKTIKQVLDYFDTDKAFINTCIRSVEEGHENFGESDLDFLAADYFNNNNECLLEYLDKNNSQIGDFFFTKLELMKKKGDIDEDAEITDYDTLKEVFDEMNFDDVTFDDLEYAETELVKDKEEFRSFISENYYRDFNFEQDEYWNDLIDYLREHEDENRLPVYRMIHIPESMEDLENKIKNYKGVGNYWTYSEGQAESYNAYSESEKKYNDIMLKAYVDVVNVNWDLTFERAVYSLKEECEIYIKSDTTVDLFAIELSDKLHEIWSNKDITSLLDELIGNDYQKRNLAEKGLKQNVLDQSTITFDEPITIHIGSN